MNSGFRFRLLFLWFLLATQLEFAVSAHSQTTPTPKDTFIYFDGTLYKNKPDMTQYGLQPIYIIYGGEFYPKGANNKDIPDSNLTREVARKAQTKTKMAVINLEAWPLKGNRQVIEENLSKYLRVLNWFRDEAPDVKIGYYGRPPVSDYSRAILGPSHHDYHAWQRENDGILSLYNDTDVFFPSLYTFYSDPEGWVKYAIAQINETRRLGNGRPVYVFMWPQYHSSNRRLGYQYISPDFWQLQLQTARQYADGIVIWGGWDFGNNRQAEWDESASWWQVTKRFMEQKPSVPPTNLTVR